MFPLFGSLHGCMTDIVANFSQTIARMELEKLWEEAGGLPHITRRSGRED